MSRLNHLLASYRVVLLTGPPQKNLSTGFQTNWPGISLSVSSHKGYSFRGAKGSLYLFCPIQIPSSVFGMEQPRSDPEGLSIVFAWSSCPKRPKSLNVKNLCFIETYPPNFKLFWYKTTRNQRISMIFKVVPLFFELKLVFIWV